MFSGFYSETALEQMLNVVLNWAKQMITDTCAAHIKQSVHVELWVQRDIADSTHLLLAFLGER